MPGFADHFSASSRAYARYRPGYPEALFDYLAEQAPARGLAWDCATGGGQAAGPLAARFRRVLATDASLAQLSRRARVRGVHFGAALAETAPLADRTVDLLTVSQALHWFDFDRFFAEVERLLAPGGVVAAWSYDLFRVDRAIDAVVDRFAEAVVGRYWPPERVHVDTRYASMPFPFERLEAPSLTMSAEWSRDDLIGYVGSWSAVSGYRKAVGSDPMPLLAADLERAWVDREAKRAVTWNLTVLAGRASRDARESDDRI